MSDNPYEAETDDQLRRPWFDAAERQASDILHLVVAWFHDEPERVGQVAALDRPAWLARAPRGDGVLSFHTQRPTVNQLAPDIVHSQISRKHLEITPLASDVAHVRNHSGRPLLVNGQPVDGESMLAHGDTLMIDGVALFLVEARPSMLRLPRHFTPLDFDFGAPDAFGMVGESPAAWGLRENLALAAASDGHTMLWGEPGSGKESSARTIHGLSARARGPFVDRNAATLPHGLADAELFGCAKDYTHKGAEERLGAFGSAHEGCLFLDEAGDLPEEVQVKLLRALDDGRFVRLGDGRTQVADVLVVGATNRGPDALRQDFLDRFQYRLRVPNLNQRLSDVPLLLRHLFAKHARTVPEFVEQFCPDGDPSRPQVNPDFLNLLLRPRYSATRASCRAWCSPRRATASGVT